MKSIRLVLVLLAVGMLVACQQKPSHNNLNAHFTSFTQLEKYFADPPAAFRTAPFMVWHNKVTRSGIDSTLTAFKNQGIGGFFIHPRYGLITEYLSDEWFELVDYAVNKAKSMGMKAWIYDENSFPSGFAGGHVPEEMPESVNQGQGLVLEKYSALPPNADAYELVLRKTPDSFKVMDAASLINNRAAGEFYLFKKTFYDTTKFYANRSYVDLLYPGVTEKFIEITMPGYERHVGNEFGATVPGVFTDEPNISAPENQNCIRWTPDLFERFQERWGYDLKTNLPCLFEETGDWKKVRHNYFALLVELFIERWSKPWHAYTEQHNLLWTGHYWEHGWPNPHHGGDNMAMYAWHQVPGIDMLFNNFSDQGAQFGNARAVKELSSVANQMGRHRTLSETYGAAGWDLTFQDMKRLGDWEYVLGVNLMNQHVAYMTLAGDRKHDFPQSFSWHEPWWPYYHYLADYYGRLSLCLSAGEQVNDILVMEPTTSAWMYYSSSGANARYDSIDVTFRNLVNTLEQQGIEYDLGSENIMTHKGNVVNGKFVIGERAYTIIVLPPYMDNLDQHTFSLLQQFIKQNGQVINLGNAPSFVDGAPNNELQSLVKANNWTDRATLDAYTLSLLANDDFTLTNASQNNDVHFMRRILDDGQLIFLVNSSLEQSASGTLTTMGQSVQLLDAITGEISAQRATIQDGNVTILYTLPPAGSVLYYISNEKSTTKPLVAQQLAFKTMPGNTMTIQRQGPNVLPLDYCTLQVGDTTYNDIYFYTASFKIWQQHGFNENPWVSSSQYRTEILDQGDYAADTGFDVTYSFTVDQGVDLSSFKAVVERPAFYTVSVNGSVVKPIPGEWYLDTSFGVFDISQYVQAGVNQLTITCRPMTIHAELEPVYILGDFDVCPAAHGFSIAPVTPVTKGYWNEQGLPFYAFGVAYDKTVTVDTAHQYKVKLPAWNGTVAEVLVNGKHAGVIAWPPYEMDISEKVLKGENQITIVVQGSLKSVLGPFHNVRRYGTVTPWSFKYAPEVQPAGTEYDFIGYGLTTDFEILQSESM